MEGLPLGVLSSLPPWSINVQMSALPFPHIGVRKFGITEVNEMRCYRNQTAYTWVTVRLLGCGHLCGFKVSKMDHQTIKPILKHVRRFHKGSVFQFDYHLLTFLTLQK